MIRVAVSVEGQTEEAFLNKILSKHLQCSCNVYVTPILLGRARASRAGGGNVTIEKLVSEMAILSYSHHFVSSFVDFYGFKDKENKNVDELVEEVRKGIFKNASGREHRIIPYVQLHEFEGLLFSDVDAFSVLPEATSQVIEILHQIRLESHPEEINDNRNTAPSKRILSTMPKYNKLRHGILIAQETGLDKIRAECPRFNAWVEKLEALPDCIAPNREE